jgi:hypothetical protein
MQGKRLPDRSLLVPLGEADDNAKAIHSTGAWRQRAQCGAAGMRRVATGITEPSEGRAQAIAFLIDAYDGIRTAAGKGLPHAQAVADILRDAGYDQRVQVVGFLHNVVECPLVLSIVADAVVFGERLHHRGDRVTEAVADILDAARRVLRVQRGGAGISVRVS